MKPTALYTTTLCSILQLPLTLSIQDALPGSLEGLHYGEKVATTVISFQGCYIHFPATGVMQLALSQSLYLHLPSYHLSNRATLGKVQST